MAGENFDINALKNDTVLDTPAASGTTPPADAGTTPPADGGTPPVVIPPAGGTTPPANNGTPPAGDGTNTPPAGGATPPPADGGTSPTPPTPPADGGTPPTPPVVPLDEAALRKKFEEEMFGELGVKSKEELAQKLKVPETPEEIKTREQKYKSNVDNYAVEKGLMQRDDIIALETMKTLEPEKLVFNSFAKDYKTAHPDATDETINQEYRLFYHLDSDQAPLKALGQERIKNEAANIISSQESKYNSAKESFDYEQQRRVKLPEFQKLIKSSIETNIPKQLPIYGDGDDKVLFDMTDADRAEAEKFLAKADIFEEFFKQGASQQVQDLIKDKIEGFLWLKNRTAILKTVYDTAESVGVKKGSSTGATQPFTLNASGEKVPVVEGELSEEEKAKVKKLLG